jgi:hypothetical protein
MLTNSGLYSMVDSANNETESLCSTVRESVKWRALC